MAAYQREVLDRFEVIHQLVFCELFKFAQNFRPPGTSFYDIVPAISPSETTAATTTTTTTNVWTYDDDNNDSDKDEDGERRIIEYGEIEDGEMEDREMEDGEIEAGGTGDVETVKDEGLLL